MSAVLTVAMLQDDKPTQYVPATVKTFQQHPFFPSDAFMEAGPTPFVRRGA